MRVLNLFDLGSFIHAGACNTHAVIETEPDIVGDGYRTCKIPCGGIAQVFTKVKSCPPNSSYVFACDRNPTIKKGMYSGYKASRVHDRRIELIKDITEYILRDCNFTVVAEEGYEADDIIYSLVDEHKKSYDQINIFTADSDMYFLVDDNVSILPSHSRAKTVTKENYRDTVSKSEYVPYNALTLLKIIRGDKSDEIPPLPASVVSRLPSMPTNESAYVDMGKKAILLALGAAAGQAYKDQVNLVYPLKVDVPKEMIEQGDLNRMAIWGRTMHCSAFGRGYNTVHPDVSDAVNDMVEKGLYED